METTKNKMNEKTEAIAKEMKMNKVRVKVIIKKYFENNGWQKPEPYYIYDAKLEEQAERVFNEIIEGLANVSSKADNIKFMIASKLREGARRCDLKDTYATQFADRIYEIVGNIVDQRLRIKKVYRKRADEAKGVIRESLYELTGNDNIPEGQVALIFKRVVKSIDNAKEVNEDELKKHFAVAFVVWVKHLFDEMGLDVCKYNHRQWIEYGKIFATRFNNIRMW